MKPIVLIISALSLGAVVVESADYALAGTEGDPGIAPEWEHECEEQLCNLRARLASAPIRAADTELRDTFLAELEAAQDRRCAALSYECELLCLQCCLSKTKETLTSVLGEYEKAGRRKAAALMVARLDAVLAELGSTEREIKKQATVVATLNCALEGTCRRFSRADLTAFTHANLEDARLKLKCAMDSCLKPDQLPGGKLDERCKEPKNSDSGSSGSASSSSVPPNAPPADAPRR